MSNCKNCHECFVFHNSESCHYSRYGNKNKFCFDVNFTDESELTYNSTNCQENYNVKFANLVWFCSYTNYATNCFNSSNLFGCVGMKRTSHSILNKQYSEDKWQVMVEKIIEHMKSTGEWGQYYPMSLSPFGYNETIANEHFPLEKEDAIKKGLNWKDELHEKKIKNEQNIIICEITGKPFRILTQELELYEKLNVPKPTIHPFERHLRRMKPMTQFEIQKRKCSKCSTIMQTTYDVNKAAIIYCNDCYLQEFY